MLDQQQKEEISELFEKVGDKEALKLLYDYTRDSIVKIALDWVSDDSLNVLEVNTYQNEMYNDIIEYLYVRFIE